MDSVTQAVLGASVGDLTLGRKAGKKALWWGVALGTLPDLDAVIGRFLGPHLELTIHRSLTHSIFFAVLGGAAVAYGLAKLHRDLAIPWQRWWWFCMAIFITHSVLDCFTTFGTQVWQPFSDHKIAWCTVSVVDPGYTVPLLAGLLLALRHKPDDSRRYRFQLIGLALSSLYLLWALAIKSYAGHRFESALADQQITYERLLTKPTPMNTFLWRGVAASESGYHVGYWSVFDSSARKISFRHTPHDRHHLAAWKGMDAVAVVEWVTDGFLAVSPTESGLRINDLRYGRIGDWSDGVLGEYVFAYDLRMVDGQVRIQRHQRVERISKDARQRFGQRIFGRDQAP